MPCAVHYILVAYFTHHSCVLFILNLPSCYSSSQSFCAHKAPFAASSSPAHVKLPSFQLLSQTGFLPTASSLSSKLLLKNDNLQARRARILLQGIHSLTSEYLLAYQALCTLSTS